MLREKMKERKMMLLNGWMMDASRSDSGERNGYNCKSGRRKTPRGRFLYAHNRRVSGRRTTAKNELAGRVNVGI